MKICITPGEPAGVGPDVLLKSIQSNFECELVAIASPKLLEQRAKLLGIELKLHEFNNDKPIQSGNGNLSIVPVELADECVAGELNAKNANYVLQTLHHAHEFCESKICDAVITGPVQKSILIQTDEIFRGHTEFFAKLCNVDEVLMCFYNPKLIIALATTHYPLSEVCEHITTKRLSSCLKLLSHGTEKYFRPKNKTLAVLGLNPHAGEKGQLGTQEEEIITPAINNFKGSSLDIIGPLAADTAFTSIMRDKIGAYLAMYHDQGLIAIKSLYFNEVVNITLGLPYLRTSVDHGTALNLAGTNKANNNSFKYVLKQTQKFISSKAPNDTN
jgi:4-hydroxythreonine-4-phosphate dehydrogenase